MRALRLAVRLLCVSLTSAALVTATPVAAEAAGRKPEDVLKRRVILSEKPFPASFKSDAAFISTMKQYDTKGFKYAGREKIPVEFMAFFAEPVNLTQLTGSVYDVTERLEMKDTFPIYPGQRGGRVLASYFELRKDNLEPERRYKFVITTGYRGLVLAEADFAIKAD